MAMPHLPLRLKITLWLLAVFSLVYAAMVLAAWALFREVEARSVDERLREISDGIIEYMQEDFGEFTQEDLRRAQPIDRQHSILAVREANGRPIVVRWGVDAEALPPLPAGGTSAVSAITELNPRTSGRLVGHNIDTRMITTGFFVSGGVLLFVDIARTTSIHTRTMSFVQELVLIGVIGALLASLAASWIIAGRAVAPLRRLAEAARVVDPEHIETRFAVASTDAEVDRLQHELNDALERLADGYRAQEQFISHVAHDLKTPITVMLTESQIIRPEDATREELESYRRSIIDEMQRMGGLVESFLTLARADQGEAMARRTDVPVNDLVVESVARCDADAQRNEVRLMPTLIDSGDEREPPEVYGDPDLLCTMLDNLIRNAIRHSPPGEQVEITAAAHDGMVRLQVRDYGPGIGEDFIGHVFDRFARAPASRRDRSDGLGLGLAIARSVADSHGGGIGVVNCPDGGCVFTVSLPIGRTEPAGGARMNAD